MSSESPKEIKVTGVNGVKEFSIPGEATISARDRVKMQEDQGDFPEDGRVELSSEKARAWKHAPHRGTAQGPLVRGR